MVVLFLVFKEPPYCSSQWLYQFTFPPTLQEEFPFLHTLSSIYYLQTFLFNKFICLFIYLIYFWLHWAFIAVCRLSLVAASRGYSSLWCTGFSLWWLLLLQSTGSRARRLQQLRRTGLAAPWHVGSSRIRAQTCVSCIGRQILNHCATREAPICRLFDDGHSDWCEVIDTSWQF